MAAKGRSSIGACLALALVAGCGGEPPAGAPQVAPVDSGALADVSSGLPLDRAEVLRQGRALGLDGSLGLEAVAPGADPTAGPPAPALPEPPPCARETPRALLASALQLLRAGDPAALARLVRSRAEDPVLDQDDAAEARRRFLGPATRVYWERLLGGAAAGALQVVREDEREAVVRVEVGGAAGAYVLRLRREGDEWFLVG